MRKYQSIGIVWASSLMVLSWADVSRAIPPAAGLTTNSLSVSTSKTGRYRPQKPTVSPYLALAPGGLGGSAAINYLTVVRPELMQRQVNQQQGFQLYEIERQLRQAEDDEAEYRALNKPETGFMTQKKYFFTSDKQFSNQAPGQNNSKSPRR